MFKIFISSTFLNLQEERKIVIKVIDELAKKYPISWEGMENFGSYSSSILEVSTGEVKKSDFVILLVGENYGSYAPEHKISFTDAEFRTVLQEKIPCLIYFKNENNSEITQEAKAFKDRILLELKATPKLYNDLIDLENSLRLDLEKELSLCSFESMPIQLGQQTMPYLDCAAFKGRKEELEQLKEKLKREGSRIGVWGSRGIGKTTLAQYFFTTYKKLLYQPIWLRVDELFGRKPNGSRRLGMTYWGKENLLKELKKTLIGNPRAVLVFDNVQAAPSMVAWIVDRLINCKIILLSWDKRAFPAGISTIELHLMPKEEAFSILQHYCHDEQLYEEEALKNLVFLLESQPFLLTMAGRRLQEDKHLSVADLAKELKEERNKLDLEGTTTDTSFNTMRALLLSSYECLSGLERKALSILGAMPGVGISENTYKWIKSNCTNLDVPIKNLNRVLQLGFMERHRYPDWRGYLFRIRSLVYEFLETTDDAEDGKKLVERYLLSDVVSDDQSVDVVRESLKLKLNTKSEEVFKNEYLEKCLIDNRQAIRQNVIQLLVSWSDREKILELEPIIRDWLINPLPENQTIELIELLGDLKISESRPVLENRWLNPEIEKLNSRDRYFHPKVTFVAAKALAKLENSTIEHWIETQLNSGIFQRIKSGLETVSYQYFDGFEEKLLELLNSNNAEIRKLSIDACYPYLNMDDNIIERLNVIFETDPNKNIRKAAVFKLGLISDKRILPYLLSILKKGDSDEKAQAVSVLRHFKSKEVADSLYEEYLNDKAPNLRELVIFVLGEFCDPRLAEVALQRLVDARDDKAKYLAAFFIGSFVKNEISDSIRRRIVTRLENYLTSKASDVRLMSRYALLKLHESVAYDGLWEDLNIADAKHNARSMPLMALEHWQPPGFQILKLRKLLGDDDPVVRAFTAKLLGVLHCQDLVEDILLLEEDEAEIFPHSPQKKSVGKYASEALDQIAGLVKSITPKQILRYEPNHNLSNQDVLQLIQDRDFYDSQRNKEGRGIEHNYHLKQFCGDKVLQDWSTGLMWHISGSEEQMKYDDVAFFIEKLNSNKYAQFSDWRLPTLDELMSILEPEKLKYKKFHLNPLFKSKIGWLWSADKKNSRKTWCVGFSYGLCCDYMDTLPIGRVRPVRSH